MNELVNSPSVEAGPARVATLSRKRLFQIHGWLGMTFGSLLFVICFSGAAAALSYEIDWLLNPAIRSWPESDRLGWEDWEKAATVARPDWKIRWISAPRTRYFAAEVIAESPSGQLRRIYVNPYNGSVQGGSSYFNVQRFLRDFHRMLNLSTPGLFVVSFFGFTLLFSVVSGLLFYKNWKRNLFQLRLRKGARAFWSDMHRLAGVWSFLFAAIIGVTGVWYFVEYAMAQNGLLRPEAPVKLSVANLKGYGPTPRLLDLDKLADSARESISDLDVRTIWLPVKADDPVRIDGQSDALLVRDRANEVLLDPYNGEVLKVQRAEELSAFRRWEDTADPLHFGDFGGVPTKIIWSVFGMALPLLVLTGSYLSIRQGVQSGSRWTIWTWLSVLVLGAALYSSYGAAERYRTPLLPTYVPQGRVTLGPWMAEVATGLGAVRIGALYEGGEPSFKSISLRVDDADAAVTARGRYWIADSVKLPDGATARLEIGIEDWTGAKHRGELVVSRSALNGLPKSVPEEGPYTGIGTWLFVVPFLVILVGVFAVWTVRFGGWTARFR